ncbi:hypothetical protein CP533_6186 [Ophiocordyceps camponoti-saundersi (nom. inval.)]|nr:hypothetical protein CP533_6186 [Ophiocordyceps camponoti-saundersi (nom. inval.)]
MSDIHSTKSPDLEAEKSQHHLHHHDNYHPHHHHHNDDDDNDNGLAHVGVETSPETSLHRGLRARHITMLAIGGALGTGLIVGTGKGLAQAGPGSLFIAFTFVGLIVFIVLAGIGEMAAWLPLSSGFTGLTAASLVFQFWVPRERLNPGVLVAIFLVAIFCINYFGGITFFGEFEFWLSSFKVIVVLGIILFSLILACGGGPTGDRPGFRYWTNPGAFARLYAPGAVGQWVGFWSVMTLATFAYLGVELCAVTAAEAQNPRRSVPKAIKLTFYRILVFYCLSVLLVGLLVPYNSEKLAFAAKSGSSSASASPFVVAAELAGVKVLPHIINACICIFVFSAANSDLYIGSRTLYGLASDGAAPAIFKRVDSRGVPYPALITCTLFACLAFLVVSDDSREIFNYFVNVTTVFGLLVWCSLLVAYISFLRARRVQSIPDSAMPYVAPQGLWGSYGALFFCILITLTKNFTVFIRHGDGGFQFKDFITGYIGIPVYLALLFGHMIVTKSRGIRPADVDFFTGKDHIDAEEKDFLEKQAEERAASTGWARFYHRYVAWLF